MMRLSYKTARAIAIQRDRACLACGATERLQTHHRIPRRVLRADLPCNLVTLCERCHAAIEALDQLSRDLDWAPEVTIAAPRLKEDAQRGASIVQRAQQLLRQGGIAHGWSAAIELARQEVSF